jgi:hypothetical protein
VAVLAVNVDQSGDTAEVNCPNQPGDVTIEQN